MMKTLRTIFLGRMGRAEDALETENATIIIEQKVREAEHGHAMAKRGLVTLIARSKSERKALDLIEGRIDDLESRIKAAMVAGKHALAENAAKLLAELENERTIRQHTLTNAEDKSARIRLAIEKTQRQLIDLKQGLITARSIEAERRAVAHVKGDISANSAIAEGEAVLARLIGGVDPVEEINALEELEADLSGRSMIDRMAEAGFGAAEKIRASDVLSRLKDEMNASKKKPKTA